MTYPFSRPDAGERLSATVKWYDPTKGHRFLVPGDDSPDIYCGKAALAAVGLDTLFHRDDGLAANDNGEGADLAQRRFETKLGYGLAAFGDRFTITPEMGFGFSNAGRDYSLGWRLTREARFGGALELSMEARRHESANDGSGAGAGAQHAIRFKLMARY